MAVLKASVEASARQRQAAGGTEAEPERATGSARRRRAS
jgi:hypothetical protein